MKDELTRRRRRIAYAGPGRRQHVVDEYLEQKNIYEEAANRASTESWKKYCTQQDNESLWDGIYRVIRSTAGRYEDQLLKEGGIVVSP